MKGAMMNDQVDSALSECAKCGKRTGTVFCNGRRLCVKCYQKRNRANANRRARNDVMRDLGLVRVRGALGGIYWE